MATTKIVTGHTIDSIRINDDQSIVIRLTVTYDDLTTETMETYAFRLVR